MPARTSPYVLDADGGRNPWVPDLSHYIFAVIVMKCLFDLFVSHDTFWHVRIGEWIWANRQIPTEEPGFAIQEVPLPWIDHEWLAQVLLYPLWRFGGFLGVRVILALIPALIFQWVYRQLRAGGTAPLQALGLVVVAAAATAHHWFARPHLIAWLVLLGSLYLWKRVWSGHRLAGVALLVLHVLWVNLHGTFLCHFVIAAVYLAEALTERGRARARRHRAAGILGLLLLLAAASLINPYGWRLFTAPAPFIDPPELRILEWEPFGPSDFSFYAFLGYAAVLSWAFWKERRRVALSELLLSVVMLVLGAVASRHVSLFVLATLPSFVRHCAGVCGRRQDRRESPLSLVPRPIRAGCRWANEAVHEWERRHDGRNLLGVVLAILVGLSLASAAGFLRGPAWDGINQEETPVRAGEFLHRERIHGRIFTDYGWAGYLVFLIGPESQVFIDGRAEMYGSSRIREYRAVVDGTPGWRSILWHYRIDIVLHQTGSALCNRLRRERGWKSVYSDRQASVFLRLSALPEPQEAGGAVESPIENLRNVRR